MDNPVDDHDLDASLPSVGKPAVTDGITPKGTKDSTALDRGKFSPWAAGRGYSAHFVRAIMVFPVFYCGCALMMILVFGQMSAAGLNARLAARPYLGVKWLLSAPVLAAATRMAAYYLWGMGARIRRFRTDARGKGASDFTLLLAALGFIGGAIPRSLRHIVPSPRGG
jgi:hypothetical protein